MSYTVTIKAPVTGPLKSATGATHYARNRAAKAALNILAEGKWLCEDWYADELDFKYSGEEFSLRDQLRVFLSQGFTLDDIGCGRNWTEHNRISLNRSKLEYKATPGKASLT